MINLTQQQHDALIKEIKHCQTEYYPSEMLGQVLAIALAALEAEPVYQYCMGDRTNTWHDVTPNDYTVADDAGFLTRIVYTAPPVPVLKPVVLKGGSLKPDGKFWYSEDTVREIIREAGYPIAGEE